LALEISESEGELMNESQAWNEKQQLYAEQVRQLHKQAPIGVVTTPIVSLIVIIVLWKVSPHWILITWFSAILLVSIPRYLLIVKFLGSSQTHAQTHRYSTWFNIGAALSGIVWGSTGIFLLPVNSLAHQIFIGVVLCGMVAGAAGTYSAVIKAFVFYSLPALVPIIIRFFLFADKMHISLGSLTLLFGLAMFTNARRINAAIVSSLKLRAENMNLIEGLKAEKERAEAANRAKSDFLASMSHELRTPLTAIIGFSDILYERSFGPLNEKQEKYVKDVLDSGRHLLSLINDILDLSKVEAGKMEPELSPVNINALIENSLVMIKEKAMKHGIRLELELLQKRPNLEIQADERMLKQVMFNLLSNATKFTSDGGRITVAAKEEGKDIIISVSDTGIGISPDLQGKIFKEFYQVKGGMLDKTPGTGLGLPLIKRFVEMHGGKIWVESEGKGSCFSFLLPMEPKPPEDRKLDY